MTTSALQLGNVPVATAIIDSTAQEAGNHITFITPSQTGIPAGLGNTKDHVLASASGAVLFRVNNVSNAANFVRHQPAATNSMPTLCFDGLDGVVSGVIQTKGGNLYVSAAETTGPATNLATFLNVPNATNWIVTQNAAPGSLSTIATNSGGLGIQPKGALWLAPSGGLFASGLPTTRPASGSGQVWNNGGVLSIA